MRRNRLHSASSIDEPRPSLAINFHWTAEALEELAQLFQAGRLKSVVDRSYPLEQVVLAHRYVEQGHKRGNVVLTIDETE